MAVRHLYLARHAEPGGDGRLTERGARQLGSQVPVAELDAAGDYVPQVPSPDEVDPEHRAGVMAFLADVSSAEAARGAELAAEAIRLLTGPEQVGDDSHHLVVTHAFTVGWLTGHTW